MRAGRAGVLGLLVTFARSPQGQRMIREARRKYDTPENRARARQAVADLRQSRQKRR